MDSLHEFIGVVSPIFSIIVGLFAIIIKLHVKRLDDKIENEKILRTENQKRHDDLIEELFKSRVSKELCIEKHKWNGHKRE